MSITERYIHPRGQFKKPCTGREAAKGGHTFGHTGQSYGSLLASFDCGIHLIWRELMVRPDRFELPTFWFVARRSIQLSYGRNRPQYNNGLRLKIYGFSRVFARIL
jgi:hypothetical protein